MVDTTPRREFFTSRRAKRRSDPVYPSTVPATPPQPQSHHHHHHSRISQDGYTSGKSNAIAPSNSFPPQQRERTSHLRQADSRHLQQHSKRKSNMMSIRTHMVAAIGEFAGTFMFLLIAFAGTQVANSATPAADAGTITTSNPSLLQYISLVFGFSLAVNVWIFYRISGGLFNPAVTLGLAINKVITPIRAVWIFVAQVLAGMASAGVAEALLPGKLSVKTTLGSGTSIAQGLFIEMFLTALLVFTIFMLAAEKHKGTFLAPVGIGLALFVCELAGVFFTGGSLNPTRSFGPCVVAREFEGYHWIYWLGPTLGALLASGFYAFVKAAHYEDVNPGQDHNEYEASTDDLEKGPNKRDSRMSRGSMTPGDPGTPGAPQTHQA